MTNEQDLRYILDGSVKECAEMGISVSEQEYISAMNGFMTVSAESCFQQKCIFGTIFDEAAECAQVEPDSNGCLMSAVLEMLNGGLMVVPLYETSCEPVNEFVSYLIMEAASTCSPVSSEAIGNATSDLTAIFEARHCWGHDGCGEEKYEDPSQDDNDDATDNSDGSDDGTDFFNVVINYVEQCAGLDVDTETCLATETIDFITASSLDPPSGRRILQMASEDDECIPPEIDEPMMRSIIEGSRQMCFHKGFVVSDQEFENTVDDFMNLFGAQNCWASLCEEESNPSDLLVKVLFEEIAQCASADLDLNPCLLDQTVGLIFSSDSPDNLSGVRRKLEGTFVSPEESSSDENTDPCAEQVSDAELNFIVSLLLAGAQEQCMELGETIVAGEVAKAESELFKLFGAQHCWGVPSDCNDQHDEHHSNQNASYLEFIEESSHWLLGQCAGAVEISCVFSRSIEVMHGMKHLDWSHDDLNDLAQESALNICTPPFVDEYDIEEVAANAKEHCIKTGALVADIDYYYNLAVNDLKNLVAKPECWEDLCEPEVKDILVEEWMHTCALMDLKYLTTQGSYMSGDASLDSDMLRCMTDYIASKEGPSANWSCGLPHLGHDVCGFDIGKEAYIHCGGLLPTSPSPSSPPSPSPSSPPTNLPTSSPTHLPSPSLSMHFSMSFAYNEYDEFNWAQYDEPEMSFSYSIDQQFSYSSFDQPDNDETVYSSFDHVDDDGFSMPYDDWYDDGYDVHEHESEMSLYIEEVCNLISEVNVDVAQHCLQPVCDLGIEDAFALSPTPSPSSGSSSITTGASQYPTQYPILEYSSHPSQYPSQYPTKGPTEDPTKGPTEGPIQGPTQGPSPTPDIAPLPTQTPSVFSSIEPSGNPSSHPSIEPSGNPSSLPSTEPSGNPSSDPSTEPSGNPSSHPSTHPTGQPSSPPSEPNYGLVEVSIEVEVTLEGINMADIDLNSLDAVVDLLSEVFKKILPKGAFVRILSVGGFSVTRRLLRFLQDDGTGGVPVEFEIVMKETCDSAKCSDAETNEISANLYQVVTTDLKEKVDSGELVTELQEEAQAQGVSELSNVTINASTMQVSEAKVTVKEANVDDDDSITVDDDDSASNRLGIAAATMAVVLSMTWLHI
ncbi:hypothetical protein ACHAXR_012524 [Thalassiosira sp. AJA248-18]